eukprot:s548_g41.t1
MSESCGSQQKKTWGVGKTICHAHPPKTGCRKTCGSSASFTSGVTRRKDEKGTVTGTSSALFVLDLGKVLSEQQEQSSHWNRAVPVQTGTEKEATIDPAQCLK